MSEIDLRSNCVFVKKLEEANTILGKDTTLPICWKNLGGYLTITKTILMCSARLGMKQSLKFETVPFENVFFEPKPSWPIFQNTGVHTQLPFCYRLLSYYSRLMSFKNFVLEILFMSHLEYVYYIKKTDNLSNLDNKRAHN